MNRTSTYDALAGLLRYPDAGYLQRMEAARSGLERHAPELAAQIRALAAQFAALSPEEMEELFTQTFDLNPVCSLEIGWHLFGENYERGTLMARIRRELARHGVRECGELPDHLTHVLQLLARMTPDAADEFYVACVAPALVKMKGAIAARSGNPFAGVFEVICRWMHVRHGASLSELPVPAVQLPVLQEAAYE